MSPESYVAEREKRFLSLYAEVRRAVRPPKMASWVHSLPGQEEKLFAIFLQGLCGDAYSGEKLYRALGGWNRFVSIAGSNDRRAIGDAWLSVKDRLRFLKHRRVEHRSFIVGKDPWRDFERSASYKYWELTSTAGTQVRFFTRHFWDVFNDLLEIPGAGRTLAFDLIEDVYRNVVDHADLRPRSLCIEGSTGPLKGLLLLCFGSRRLHMRDLKAKAELLWGKDIPPWEALETYSQNLVFEAEELARPSERSVEYVVFQLEDLICNYQKPNILQVEGIADLPAAFLDGQVDAADFAVQYIRAYER